MVAGHVIAYRHADPRFPFFWESGFQPGARWHEDGNGPVQYLCDTPDGAWAEFLRHEEISDPDDLETVRRSLWAIDIGTEQLASPDLPPDVETGDADSYPPCREEAVRLRNAGAVGLRARSAALKPGKAGGWRVDGGLQRDAKRDGETIVLFGRRPDLTGWRSTFAGRPDAELLDAVRHFFRPAQSGRTRSSSR